MIHRVSESHGMGGVSNSLTDAPYDGITLETQTIVEAN